MRLCIIALVILLSGCVSQPQPGKYASDDFDQEEAAKTRISLGLTYLKNGNYTQAKANLDKALEFAPRLADTHYSLAYYYQLVGEVQRAEDSYSNAMRLAPRDADIANSYGAFLCQQGRYDDAKDYFLKAVNNKQYASSAETYENMALCAQSQGNVDDAITYFQSALNHQPTRGKSLYLLTQLYVSKQQWDDAEKTLRKYERVARVSPETLELAREIAQGKNDQTTADGYGEMLLTMYPGSAQAKAYVEEKAARSAPKAKVTNKAPVVKAEPPSTSSGTEESVVAEPVGPSTHQQVQDSASSGTGELDVRDVVSEAETVVPEAETLVPEAETVVPEVLEGPRYHIVQKKENLYRISLKYNIKMSMLQDWNNLGESGAIFAGMKLWIVPPEQQEK